MNPTFSHAHRAPLGWALLSLCAAACAADTPPPLIEAGFTDLTVTRDSASPADAAGPDAPGLDGSGLDARDSALQDTLRPEVLGLTDVSDAARDAPSDLARDAPSDVVPDGPCAAGLSLCGAACVNLLVSGSHCGRCSNACPTGQTCTGGACRIACPAPRDICAAGAAMTCVDTRSDPAHCGMCGRACPMGLVCAMGACACPAGQSLCEGRCVSTLADTSHCGMCGRACPMGLI